MSTYSDDEETQIWDLFDGGTSNDISAHILNEYMDVILKYVCSGYLGDLLLDQWKVIKFDVILESLKKYDDDDACRLKILRAVCRQNNFENVQTILEIGNYMIAGKRMHSFEQLNTVFTEIKCPDVFELIRDHFAITQQEICDHDFDYEEYLIRLFLDQSHELIKLFVGFFHISREDLITAAHKSMYMCTNAWYKKELFNMHQICPP